MILPAPRDGSDILIRKKRIPFSFWPTYSGSSREGLQWTLFATDPWYMIENYVQSLEDEIAREEAESFVNQAKDFFRASTHSEVGATKPVLLYYCFLNLVKCLSVYRDECSIGYQIKHGISEKLPVTPGAIHGDARVLRNQDSESAFKKLSDALGDALPNPPPGASHFDIRSQDFLAQILIGHRVWCHGEGVRERFISLQDIRYRHDSDSREAWLTVRMHKDDLTRHSYSQTKASNSLNLRGGGAFRAVSCDRRDVDGRLLVEFESEFTVQYPNRPSEALSELSRRLKKSLWRSVTSIPPYRKYYIYFPTSTQTILSQLQSLYLSTYYFGSITRYKPRHFRHILESDMGPFVQEFFTNQPTQFLYLLTSEFIEQEVTRAAIV